VWSRLTDGEGYEEGKGKKDSGRKRVRHHGVYVSQMTSRQVLSLFHVLTAERRHGLKVRELVCHRFEEGRAERARHFTGLESMGEFSGPHRCQFQTTQVLPFFLFAGLRWGSR